MVEYSSAYEYISTATTLLDKYNKVISIIDALDNQALAAALSGVPLSEYMMNDGQTIIKSVYRSEMEIQRAIAALQIRADRYLSQLNGRVIRQLPEQNFRGSCR